MRHLVWFAIDLQSYNLFMSHQQNPSSQPADVKPFSIRQFVDASRCHKSISNSNSWPFPDKYLQMCLNLGLNLNDVLPPFDFQTSSLKAPSNLIIHSQKDSKLEAGGQVCKTHQVQHVIEQQQNIKNECHSYLSHAEGYQVTNKHIPSSYDCEEGNQPNCNASINLSESADTFTLASSIHDVQKKAMKDKQHRRGRKKCKKKSMVDILAVARQCTLEDIYRINNFCYANQAVTQQGCLQMEENSFRKGGRSEDHESGNNGGMTEKGALVLKFKLNGYNVNWNSGGI